MLLLTGILRNNISMNSSKNNFDPLAAAGVADGTPCDTFMEMNGNTIYITEDDINEQGVDNLEMLHDGELPDESWIRTGIIEHTDEVLDDGRAMVAASEIPALRSE